MMVWLMEVIRDEDYGGIDREKNEGEEIDHDNNDDNNDNNDDNNDVGIEIIIIKIK